MARRALRFLYANDLLDVAGSRYALTPFSRAVMRHFWEKNTEFTLEEVLSIRKDVREYDEMTYADALFVLMSNVHWLNVRYPKKVVESVLKELGEPFTDTFADTIAVNTHVILKHWIQGDDLDSLKKKYGENVTYLKSRAKQIAAALHIVKLVAELEGVKLPPKFDTFVKRVEVGLTEYELPMAELRGFGRKIIHSIYTTMREMAATSRYVDRDEHIGITLRRIYDQYGPEKLASRLGDMNVFGLGPKRIRKIVEWIEKLDGTSGLGKVDERNLKVRRGDLSDWF